jgi:hypothetical protein
MTTRSRGEIIIRHPFRIKGSDRELGAGPCEVITDEELIEGFSFASFRRIATMMMIPAVPRGSTMEMISVGVIELSEVQRIDASAPRD